MFRSEWERIYICDAVLQLPLFVALNKSMVVAGFGRVSNFKVRKDMVSVRVKD